MHRPVALARMTAASQNLVVANGVVDLSQHPSQARSVSHGGPRPVGDGFRPATVNIGVFIGQIERTALDDLGTAYRSHVEGIPAIDQLGMGRRITLGSYREDFPFGAIRGELVGFNVALTRYDGLWLGH